MFDGNFKLKYIKIWNKRNSNSIQFNFKMNLSVITLILILLQTCFCWRCSPDDKKKLERHVQVVANKNYDSFVGSTLHNNREHFSKFLNDLLTEVNDLVINETVDDSLLYDPDTSRKDRRKERKLN